MIGPLITIPRALDNVVVLRIGNTNAEVAKFMLEKLLGAVREIHFVRDMLQPTSTPTQTTAEILLSEVHRCKALSTLTINNPCPFVVTSPQMLFRNLRVLSVTLDSWETTAQWLKAIADNRATLSLQKVSMSLSMSSQEVTEQQAGEVLQFAPVFVDDLATFSYSAEAHVALFRFFTPSCWINTCRIVTNAQREHIVARLGELRRTMRLDFLKTCDAVLAEVILRSYPLRSLSFTSTHNYPPSQLANAIRNATALEYFETTAVPRFALYLPTCLRKFCLPLAVPSHYLFNEEQDGFAVQRNETSIVRRKAYVIEEAGLLQFEREEELERLSVKCPALQRIALKNVKDCSSLGVLSRCLHRWKALRELFIDIPDEAFVENILQMFEDSSSLEVLFLSVFSMGIISEVRRLSSCLRNVRFTCAVPFSLNQFYDFFGPRTTIRLECEQTGQVLSIEEFRKSSSTRTLQEIRFRP